MNPYIDKTIEEIEVDMDRAREKIERNTLLMAKARNNTLRSKKAIEKEILPLRDEIRELTALVKMLDKLIDEKTPYWEKLPKETVFYKHLMSNMYTTKINTTAKETAQIDNSNLKEAAEEVHRFQREDIRRPFKREPSRQERDAARSLLQELQAVQI